MEPRPSYVVTEHRVTAAGHSAFRVVDMAGRYVSVTVRRRAALDGHAAAIIAAALAARPTQTRSYP